MSDVTIRAVGPVATPTAWERYADTTLWKRWSPQILGVELTDPTRQRLHAGMTGRVRGPLGLKVPFTVESVDEARMSWVWRVHVGPVKMRLHHTVAGHPKGTETTLTISGAPPVAVGYSVLAQVALHRLVRP